MDILSSNDPDQLGSSRMYPMEDARIVRVGSRKSQLALIQTNIVIEALKQHYANNGEKYLFEVVKMSTIGDEILDKALPEIGAKSLFTADLEKALLDKNVDFVVHSLKDMPTTLPAGCAIGCITERDDKDDAIVIKQSLTDKIEPTELLKTDNSRQIHQAVGTSSQRRIAMMKRCNNNMHCIDIRGNLNTRFRKLDDGDDYTAIVLASAGLKRLGMADRISLKLNPCSTKHVIDFDWCYAVGQGAIAVECRDEDQFIKRLLWPVIDLNTIYEVLAERALMKSLEAGCSVPLGVRTFWTGGQDILEIKGMVLSIDGQQLIEGKVTTNLSNSIGMTSTGSQTTDSNLIDLTGISLAHDMLTNEVSQKLAESARLGQRLADMLIESGAKKLLDDIKIKRTA